MNKGGFLSGGASALVDRLRCDLPSSGVFRRFQLRSPNA